MVLDGLLHHWLPWVQASALLGIGKGFSALVSCAFEVVDRLAHARRWGWVCSVLEVGRDNWLGYLVLSMS